MKRKIINSLLLTLLSINVIAQGGNTNYGTNTGYLGWFNNSFGFVAGDSVTGDFNSFFGYMSGRIASGDYNSFFGDRTGMNLTTGSNNSLFGSSAGISLTTGSDNTIIGQYSGQKINSGDYNTYLGSMSGYNNLAGSNNVFVGYKSGYNETGSNKLYIDNSDTSTPLIYGDFSTDILTVNGKLGVGTTTPRGHFDVDGVGDIYLIDEPNGGTTQSIFIPGHIYIAPYHSGTDWTYVQARRPNTSGSTHLRFRTTNSGSLTDAMSILGNGYVGIGSIMPSYLFQVKNAYCDGNSWYNVSDKNLKENFARIKPEESILDKLMELPVQYWNYKGENSNRHIGPTAQDFHDVFQLGNNEKAISTVDESGVAFAAIQELSNKTTGAIKELNQKIIELAQIVNTQQKLLSSLLIEDKNSVTVNESGVILNQNHPNPFSRDTEIIMEIPETISSAIFYVYDIQGKIINKQIVKERGKTSVKIDAGSLSSGIYLYTLIADGNQVGLKRMILTD